MKPAIYTKAFLRFFVRELLLISNKKEQFYNLGEVDLFLDRTLIRLEVIRRNPGGYNPIIRDD